MSKDLPYFRFYPSEWLEGDITLENERTQWLFLTIMAWYWKKDCVIDFKFIQKRIIKGKATLKQCLENLIIAGILKVDENELISINFLDRQYDYLSEKRQKKVEAGRSGGKAKRKQKPSKKEKEKKNNKEEKKKKENVVYFVDEKLNKTFLAFIEHRIKVKAPMTEHAKELMVNKLLKISKNNLRAAVEILNRSILSGKWTDIYALKPEEFRLYERRKQEKHLTKEEIEKSGMPEDMKKHFIKTDINIRSGETLKTSEVLQRNIYNK